MALFQMLTVLPFKFLPLYHFYVGHLTLLLPHIDRQGHFALSFQGIAIFDNNFIVHCRLHYDTLGFQISPVQIGRDLSFACHHSETITLAGPISSITSLAADVSFSGDPDLSHAFALEVFPTTVSTVM